MSETHDFCNRLYRGCEPLISFDSCCEDYVTVVK